MPHTLLLADDSVTIQRVIELTFAEEDVRVVAVSDGDQAIALLNQTPPDIVLADVGMPGANGYEVARYMRDTPRLSHIPVVLLTGAFEPIDQARANDVNCDGVLAKPFEPQLVIGRVKELLAKPKLATASIDAELAPPPTQPEAWMPALEDQLRAHVPAKASEPIHPQSDENYFDKLDAALSLHTPPAPLVDLPLSASAEVAAAPRAVAIEAPPVFSAPAPVAPSVATVSSVASGPIAVVPPPSVALPPLADAFAALLAAEQSGPAPVASPWAAASPPVSAVVQPAPLLTEDLIEQVAQRVLARLSDGILREAIAERVSLVAERVIREEIDQLKREAE